MICNEVYKQWIQNADISLQNELKSMDNSSIKDAFSCGLSFGTGGLRGILGPGTNRMNIHTVARASQGLANYLGHGAKVVIGYDSRINSELFAKVTAGVFIHSGVKVYMWPNITPVPTVSYAIRKLNCNAGVMITASHNPSNYNGYKVYGPDGCQITNEVAATISNEISQIEIFDVPVKVSDSAEYVDPKVFTDYLEDVKKESVLFGDSVNKDIEIVYTPLNGTGLIPVTRVLAETGFKNITVVKEQKDPDGTFPTCPRPNPEIREAMELGIAYCKQKKADLLIATDPDCDRCGIAEKTRSGGYALLTGNEVGLLLLDFICSQRSRHNKMPELPVFVKTIVTTDLAERIAERYGVETINVLTGFKYIGETIGKLEESGREKDFICGFEESYGYLTGDYVRDKDGVNASLMISEMFAYYRTRGLTLLEKLQELYRTYGYCANTLQTYRFEGVTGAKKLGSVMSNLRTMKETLGKYKINSIVDYWQGVRDMPKADVLQFCFEFGSVIIRPSGTEPLLKAYFSIHAKDKNVAESIQKELVGELDRFIAS